MRFSKELKPTQPLIDIPPLPDIAPPPHTPVPMRPKIDPILDDSERLLGPVKNSAISAGVGRSQSTSRVPSAGTR